MRARLDQLLKETARMSFSQQDSLQEDFPQENYAALRKNNDAPSAVVIPYKPAEEPAWDKHNPTLPPKPHRFSKLNKWDAKRSNMETMVKWIVVAAGTAGAATPVLMQIMH